MRMRKTLTRAAAIISVLASATVFVAGPTSAGTPYSGLCSDGNGLVETPVMTSPFTIAAEVSGVTANAQQIQLCYSTTPENSPGGVTGGWVVVHSDLVVGLTENTVRVTVTCQSDSGVTLPVNCFEQTVVQTFPAGLPTTGMSNIICLVDLGSGCLLFASGVWVKIPPVLRVTLPVGTVDVPPVRCIALLASCPP
jgi:hypothetical protein